MIRVMKPGLPHIKKIQKQSQSKIPNHPRLKNKINKNQKNKDQIVYKIK